MCPPSAYSGEMLLATLTQLRTRKIFSRNSKNDVDLVAYLVQMLDGVYLQTVQTRSLTLCSPIYCGGGRLEISNGLLWNAGIRWKCSCRFLLHQHIFVTFASTCFMQKNMLTIHWNFFNNNFLKYIRKTLVKNCKNKILFTLTWIRFIHKYTFTILAI